MKLIPLNSSQSPTHIGDDGLLIVNFDLVYCVTKNTYFPNATSDGVEGSKLFIASPTANAVPYTIEVRETRFGILQLLGRDSCFASLPRNHE